MPSRIGFADTDDCDRLRDHLRAIRYTDADLLEQVGVDAGALSEGAGAFLALGRAESGSPLETLLLLFLHGAPVAVEAARRATGPVPLERWLEAGLLAIEGGHAQAAIRLVPFRGLWLAYDRPEHKHEPGFVMGIGSSTVTLMNVSVRRPVEAMLDLGCGCGTQGFFAAGHARAVAATDRNPRALDFVRFNARLNGARHVAAASGDLFEPVAARRFGLIVSNPPFVISPDSHLIYRDGGLEGDAFSRRVVREAPDRLEEGGFCQILCNWAHVRGQPWQDRLASWFAGLPVDVWAMRSVTEDASVYAQTWIRQTEAGDPASRSARFRRWTAYYESQGIEKVSLGIITMRRTSSARPWVRIDDTPPHIQGPCGDAIARAFAARDLLETLRSDDDLLDLKPRVVPSVRLRQILRPGSGAWEAEAMNLCLESGLVENVRVDAYTAGLVSRCDGSRTLYDLIQELAVVTEQEVDRVTATVLAITRTLIERGMLQP